ncbi:hypothetical protein TNCV_4773401 [Trichonephila clavipes]|nr:hypothetical protein TNCV_4773401 [Trichonephila clavipes]
MSHFEAERGLYATDLVTLNLGQMTSPELPLHAPNFLTLPTAVLEASTNFTCIHISLVAPVLKIMTRPHRLRVRDHGHWASTSTPLYAAAFGEIGTTLYNTHLKSHETKLPVRLINTSNERRLVQGHETPLRVKGDIKDVSSELDNGGERLPFLDEMPRILLISVN